MKRGFTIHHNGPPVYTRHTEHSRCEAFWRAVRNFHVNSNGWSDIAYSFGICIHGIRFEGRGWYKNQFANGADEVGANDGPDREWYTVLAFLGEGEAPSIAMLAGLEVLVEEGRSRRLCGLQVLPHNAFKRKACPGPELTALAYVWNNNPLLSFGTLAPIGEDTMTPDDIKHGRLSDGSTINDRLLWTNQQADKAVALLGQIGQQLAAAENRIVGSVAAALAELESRIDQKLSNLTVASVPADAAAIKAAVAEAVSKIEVTVGVKP